MFKVLRATRYFTTFWFVVARTHTTTSIMVSDISASESGNVRLKSVCVVGAGAAGLCALRHFTSRLDRFGPIVCFEQTDKVGGTWNYTDKIGTDQNGLPIHSSMYRDMK